MPLHYKLSPAVIAALLGPKGRVLPPDAPLSDDDVQRAEPDFTPLDEILGERPTQVSLPASVMRQDASPGSAGIGGATLYLGDGYDASSGETNNSDGAADAALSSLPASAWRVPGIMGLAGVYTGQASKQPIGRSFDIDPGRVGGIRNIVPGVSLVPEQKYKTPSLLHSASPLPQPESRMPQPPRAVLDVLSEKTRALAQAIGMGEGDYEAHNSGTSGAKILNSVSHGAPAGTVTRKP